MLTVSTYEGKHCLLPIKKNGKTAASLKDNQVSVKTVCSRLGVECLPQSGELEAREGRGRTMLSQSCVLDLTEGDTVQVAAQANSGISGKMSNFLPVLWSSLSSVQFFLSNMSSLKAVTTI